MQRDYEILYIVRPDVEENDLPDVNQTVETLIGNLDGTVQKTNVWGKRRLAYEVDHLREGHYVLIDFQIEPARVPEMEATLKISDKVFRHLIVRKPELKAPAPTPAPAAEPAATTEAETPAVAAETPPAEAPDATAAEDAPAAGPVSGEVEADSPAVTTPATPVEAADEATPAKE